MKIIFAALIIFLLANFSQPSAKKFDSCNFSDFASVHKEKFSKLELQTVFQAEEYSMELLSSTGISTDYLIPFGEKNNDWKYIKKNIHKEDCLVYFKTSKESWKRLSGREGYMLIRRGEIIFTIITRLS